MLSEIKREFSNGNYLTRLLFINCGAFVILKLILVVLMLFELPVGWVQYVELPSDLGKLLRTPWTLFTYMFLHVDLLHVIFNLFALYWFGKIFLSFLNQKQLVGVYILGGLAGAFFYVSALNVIPYFSTVKSSSYLLGASASVMSVIFAMAAYAPNESIHIALIGDVKLKYIGLAVFIVDIVGFSSTDPGGCMAHIGGAVMGYAYGALLSKKHLDLSYPVSVILNFFADFSFKRKPKIKVKQGQRPKTDEEWNKAKNNKNARIDSILEKIKKSGYTSLSEEEKKDLFDLSR